MYLALISDIHSNLPALEAVLKSIDKKKPDKIFCLGDIIGYNTFPNEVIDLIKTNNINCLMGNHDYDIINKKFSLEKESDKIKVWTLNKLTSSNIDFLSNLPININLETSNKKITMYHSSPRSMTEYLYEDTEDTIEVMQNFKNDILICGHTHLPYYKYYNDKLIINSGSVGKPKRKNKQASYVLLNIINKKINIEIITLDYDYETTAKQNENLGFINIANSLRPT